MKRDKFDFKINQIKNSASFFFFFFFSGAQGHGPGSAMVSAMAKRHHDT